MASKTITLQIRPRGKPIRTLPDTITLPSTSTTTDLYNNLSTVTKYSPHQLRITKGSDGSLITNKQSNTIHTSGLRDQSTIYIKDLGPQIAWRTVFILEYLGPIIIHPVLFYLRPYIYPSTLFPTQPSPSASLLQTLTLLTVTMHFIKREFETLFIHRFSSATMPLLNIFKNSAHYWLLAGINIAYWVYSPSSYAATDKPNPALLYGGLALYFIGETLNFNTHVTLRDLRKPGSTDRGIPRGALFDLVTCPNYLTETISWLGVFLISGLNLSVLIFIIVAIYPMAMWAKGKEKRYRKEFGDKYKPKKFVMLPGIW